MKLTGIKPRYILFAVCTALLAATATAQVCDFCRNPRATCFLQQADVAFLFQTTNGTRESIFENSKLFVSNVLNSFSLGRCGVRVTFIGASQGINVPFNFHSNVDGDTIYTYVNGLVKGTASGQDDLAEGLEFVRDELFTTSHGSRPNVLKILVVVTDYLMMEQSKISEASSAIRNQDVDVIAIGVGDNVNPALLSQIAANEERQFFFENPIDLLTGSLLFAANQAICHDVDECLDNNGGCSDGCRNTPGSFVCTCSNETVLSVDQRTCVLAPPMEGSGSGMEENESEETSMNQTVINCDVNNGGCCQICESVSGGRNCSCHDGYALNSDGRSCSEVNECFNRPCSHYCFNTVGSFFCECPEEYELSEDGRTCVLRPGPADCPKDFKVVSHSCMMATNGSHSYASAKMSCQTRNDTRLAKIADDGTRALVTRFFPGKTWIGLEKKDRRWVNSDGTPFTYEWAYGQPNVGDCGYVQNLISSASCSELYRGACEIPRTRGFMVFGRRWGFGTQGKMYLPTGVNEVIVSFPKSIASFNVWYGTVARRINARQYLVTQGNIQRQSNNGHVGFVLTFRRFRFPDYDVRITPFTG